MGKAQWLAPPGHLRMSKPKRTREGEEERSEGRWGRREMALAGLIIVILVAAIAGWAALSAANNGGGSQSGSDSTTATPSTTDLCGGTSATSCIQILSHSDYVDTSGYAHVVGEVMNRGTQNLEFVQIKGTYYGSNGTVLEYDSTFTIINILTPQQKSPFDISANQKGIAYSSVTLEVTGASPAVDTPNTRLAILNDALSYDQYGYYHVTGQMGNAGSTTANNVQVVVTFYDSSGKVVDAAYTPPAILLGSETGTFDAGADHPMSGVASFSAQIQVTIT